MTMDDLLPDIATKVYDQPSESTEINENGADAELVDIDDNSYINKVVIPEEPKLPCEEEEPELLRKEPVLIEDQEVPSEEQNGETVTVSPFLGDDIRIPHSEQNGDIVELLDGEDEEENHLNETIEEVEHVSPSTAVEDVSASTEVVELNGEDDVVVNHSETSAETVSNNTEDNASREIIEVSDASKEIVEVSDEEKMEGNHNETNLEIESNQVEVSHMSKEIVQEVTIEPEMPNLTCESTPVENNSPLSYTTTNTDDELVKSKSKSKWRYLLPPQIPSDYTPEELEVYNSLFCRGNQAIQYVRLHCTACNIHLGSAPNKQHKRFIHPLLRVLVCRPCYEFYGSGEFEKDEDGSELYCRWCGQGGKVLCCAKCPYVFCQKCIKGNLGRTKLQEVLDSEDWMCFECVPSQTIKLRVTVRALYDFVQSEINLADELNQPDRLKLDYSLCCTNRQKPNKIKIVKVPGTKRKHSVSSENNLPKDDVQPKTKKIKLKMLPNLLTAVNENQMTLNQGKTFVNPVASSSRVWESQVEDEVVCTPDLSLLMPMTDDYEDAGEAAQTEELRPTAPAPPLPPPPLMPITTVPNKDSNMQFMEPIQPTKKFPRIRPHPSSKILGYTLPKNPVVLHATTARPLLSKVLHNTVPKTNLKSIRYPLTQQSVLVNQQNRNHIKVPSQIAPGTKHEWFEKAAQCTSRANLNLSTRLSALTKEQGSVVSIEALASIHNNFQEILNSSIKALAQIRKNLRTDFIAGLKLLKYDPLEPSVKPVQSEGTTDDDVIILDSPMPAPKPIVPSTPTTFGRLKLKPFSSLIIDSAVITIPDEVSNEPVVLKKMITTEKPSFQTVEIAQVQIPITVEEINKDKVVKVTTPPPPVTVSPEVIEDDLNPETRILIKRALQESKLETIVNDNMKIRMPSDIPVNLLKRMLTVRVIVEDKFGPATPRMRPRRGYIPMNICKGDADDIENMLSSSIVLNISKRKVFNSGAQNDLMLAMRDEVEYLNNGIL